ncbi:uridine diphosphate glucose pyrophosphatase NUDT14-like [Daphnia pulicaria]|uniref:uridine diphosphate glucose pyrophosphatase NUDT14-like n=1 Tax=Daphnia pulicaria TaxID=35523 RepID=UPI001EEA2AB7|nr:uridine diphosphate glucose pyrophosphatase NUDT14-like [Daphnia pulicaria]
MNDLSDVTIVPLENSNFVQPFRMLFKHAGKDRLWDLVRVHESVAIIIFNISKKKLIFVRQFRPAVYINSIPQEDRTNPIDTEKYPAKLGFTLELCAGIVDKKKTLAEIAAEEVLEECGYKVDPDKLEYVIQFHSGVGLSGDPQTVFYAEVTDEMKVSSGGGNPEEGELIDVVEMNISEVEEFLAQKRVPSPGGFLFGLQWFFNKKASLFVS